MRWLLGLAMIPFSVTAQDLSGLDWLGGHWSDGSTEEHWTAPDSGQMLGMNRTRGSSQFEFLRISLRGGRIYYDAYPAGRPPTAFELVTLTGNQATFENLAHDFPQRIAYRREGDRLHVVAMTQDAAQKLEWTWVRQ